MKKRQYIIDTAIRLFANQGYDATTTMQISREAKVTEPLIYYHFKNGKEELYTFVLKTAFEKYFDRMENLPKRTADQFAKIEAIIDLHLGATGEDPHEMHLVVSACPVKLKTTDHICYQYIKKQQEWLTQYISRCLQNGMRKGEFVAMPLKQTTTLILAMIVGVLVNQNSEATNKASLKKAAIEFCRRSLVK